jgi:hypothetical protein
MGARNASGNRKRKTANRGYCISVHRALTTVNFSLAGRSRGAAHTGSSWGLFQIVPLQILYWASNRTTATSRKARFRLTDPATCSTRQ